MQGSIGRADRALQANQRDLRGDVLRDVAITPRLGQIAALQGILALAGIVGDQPIQRAPGGRMSLRDRGKESRGKWAM